MSKGYVEDFVYTFGYYSELNPLRMKLAFLRKGLLFPNVGNACELGFGQGLSTNIHASASIVNWYGNDFNSAQASFAQELSIKSGNCANLSDETFEVFSRRPDLPDFDYIALHGIWSWVSDENRKIIVDFIYRKLKPGGVVYISYNTMPGWSAFAPLRHLLCEHAEVMSSKGMGVETRMDNALKFARTLIDTNPLYAQVNPRINEKLSNLSTQDHHYIAHEYFADNWSPMHFSTIAKFLSEAKLEFACSASLIEHLDALNLSSDQKALLDSITDPIFKETVRDFIVNQQFRRDYWIKGARKLPRIEPAELLSSLEVVLVSRRNSIKLEVTSALGIGNLSPSIYAPILDILSDHQPHSLLEIASKLETQEINWPVVLEAITVLAGESHIELAQEQAITKKTKPICEKLNFAITSKARSSSEISYLASPLIGGGVFVPRFQQLFILAIYKGLESPEEWAQLAWNCLSALGERLMFNNVLLESDAENLRELANQANSFAKTDLPRLRSLQIV